MTDTSHVGILRRKARIDVPEPSENPLTTSRAVRLLLPQVAQDTLGLSMSVSSVSERVAELDEMLKDLADGLMLIRLERQGALWGLLAVDIELFSAVVEIQTSGRVLGQAADTRKATGVDRLLCDGLLKGLLDRFPDALRQTAWDGWIDAVQAGPMFDDSRSAGLMMADCTYRSVQMSINLNGTDRQGSLTLYLPLPAQKDEEQTPVTPQVDWSTAIEAVVQDVPALLVAQLHRFAMPLSRAQALRVGDLVTLDGCSVSSVRLLDADGAGVATAKLGQSAGMRAVRLQAPPFQQMEDATLPGGVASLPDQFDAVAIGTSSDGNVTVQSDSASDFAGKGDTLTVRP